MSLAVLPHRYYKNNTETSSFTRTVCSIHQALRTKVPSLRNKTHFGSYQHLQETSKHHLRRFGVTGYAYTWITENAIVPTQ